MAFSHLRFAVSIPGNLSGQSRAVIVMSEPTRPSIMPSVVGPKVARANVAQRLRAMRVEAKKSVADVASAMDWSVSKLTRIEKGEVSIQPLEVRALLGHFNVTDEKLIADLSGLVRTSRSRLWYSRHRLTGAYADFVAFENEAAVISTWQMLFVPGLLQTREYARAITALTLRTDPNHEQVEARVKLRMDRQKALFERMDGPHAPRVVTVIDESVLLRPTGGRDVMTRQLDHLLELAETPDKFTLGVAPLDLEHHSGLGGAFEILNFSGDSHEDVLFVEAAGGQDFLLTDDDSTERHNALFQDLLDYGRTGDRALQLIRSARDGMRH